MMTEDAGFNFSAVVILAMTLLVPLLVLPDRLENIFDSPKSMLILLGVSILTAVSATRFLWGKSILKSGASTPLWIIILILLNFFSFLYTDNYYYTKVAVILNISCLLFFYFTSLYIDGKKAFWILAAVAFSGVLVSIITYFQFAGQFNPLFRWVPPGTNVMGTIGNSNYLGAYLLFPLFALAGLIFLIKGRMRLVPMVLLAFVFGALLLSRARASWLGLGISFPVFLLLIKNIFRFSPLEYIRANPRRVLGYGVLILFLTASLWFVAPKKFKTMMKIQNWFEIETIRKTRIKYVQASWWLFIEGPLFGNGLWSYRNRVYYAQAEINKKYPDYFKNYEVPKPRRVHNDYLEILNDGGIVSAAILLLFFITIMRHGWRVIKDEEVETREKFIVAATFSSLMGIMAAAFFFFPFRLNSTMFLTALMMGVMEGIYLRNYDLVTRTKGRKFLFAPVLIPLVFLTISGVFWYGGVRPFKGELEYFKYKKDVGQLRYLLKKKTSDKRAGRIRGIALRAEKHILKAISCDPGNSLYCHHAGQLYMLKTIRDYVKAGMFFDRVITGFNGDLSLWSVYYGNGLLKMRTGHLYEARDAFQKAIYYNPNDIQARKKLDEVKRILKKHDRVIIKFR